MPIPQENYDPEYLALERKRKFAEYLMQSGQQPVQGRMVGQFYVPPSPFQGLAQLGSAFIGNKANANIDTQEKALVDTRKQKLIDTLSKIPAGASPDETMKYGASLMSEPETQALGSSLIAQVMKQRQTAAQMQAFGFGPPGAQTAGGPVATPAGAPQAGVAMPQSGTPMPQAGVPMPQGSMPVGGAPTAQAPPGFDMRRYAAMVATGDSALIKMAEAERAGAQIPASAQASLEEKKREFANPSANALLSQSTDLYKHGHLSADQAAQLQLAGIKAKFETGMGGDPTQPSPNAEPAMPGTDPNAAPTMPGADPTAAPIAPRGTPAMTPKDTSEANKQIYIKREQQEPKVFTSLQKFKNQTELVNSAIDRASKLITPWTAGSGAMLANIPGTKAKDLESELQTVKANIAINAINEMRQNSPTGGAVGNASDNDMKMLQATLGSMDQAQTAKQLAESLQRIKKQVNGSYDRLNSAYLHDYGSFPQAQNPAAGATISPTQPARSEGVTKWGDLP